jgi:methylated-DNA-[protein]-cysteine S-methyltransferase
MPQQRTTPPPPSQGPLGSVGWGVLERSPVGPLWLAWVEEGLVMVHFGAAPPEEEQRRWLPERWPLPEARIPEPISDGLTRYFDGEPIDPATLPVRLSGTRFQRKVWTALREVRRGSVRTYAGLAADAGSPRAMRAVGVAMAHNPLALVVPCHRVVGAGMALGGYSGGLDKKRVLLGLEGVTLEGGQVLPGQLELLRGELSGS